MNRKSLLLAAIVLIVVSCGTIFALAQSNNPNEHVISSGNDFKVFDISKEGQPEYRYEIYNKNGKVVKSEIVLRVEPVISYIDGNRLLSIQTGAGTGVFLTQYYDIKAGLFSETFESPAAVKGGKIVYMEYSDEKLKLVVRDIFDKSMYYEEFELDFSPVANPSDALQSVEFLDENTLKVSYLSGDGYDEKTTILELN